MTDRTPDQSNAPDHGETTVRLDRRLTDIVVPEQARSTPPVAMAPAQPVPAARDDYTVDLSKRETDVVRVDPAALSPWARGAAGPTPAGPPPGPAAAPWAAQPAPAPWSAQQPPGSWPAQQVPPVWGSTRAMPQPPPSPPLPPARGRGHGPLIVFGILAALVIAGGAWALIALAAGSSPFGARADDPQAGAPISTDAPDPYPSAGPNPDAPNPDSTAPSDGPSGQVVVSWQVLGTDYRATITTSGATGAAEVTYRDPDSGSGIRNVHQDLTLASSDGRQAYVGRNPVESGTGAPAVGYSPDIFLLATTADGQVYIEQVCDPNGCSPATME